MTEEQTEFWNTLKYDPAVMAHSTAQELQRLKGRRFHKKVNENLELIMGVFDATAVIRIVRTWLNIYKLPLDAKHLPCFDVFHANYHRLIADSIRNKKQYEPY